MGIDQYRQQTQQSQQHAEGSQQRLGIKKVAQHAEKTKKEHHKRVASGAQFQCLEGQQYHQQRDAGIAAQKRAVAEQCGGNRQGQQSKQPPATRQRPVAHGQIAAPDQNSTRQQAAPDRQAGRLWQQNPGDDQQQK